MRVTPPSTVRSCGERTLHERARRRRVSSARKRTCRRSRIGTTQARARAGATGLRPRGSRRKLQRPDPRGRTAAEVRKLEPAAASAGARARGGEAVPRNMPPAKSTSRACCDGEPRQHARTGRAGSRTPGRTARRRRARRESGAAQPAEERDLGSARAPRCVPAVALQQVAPVNVLADHG